MPERSSSRWETYAFPLELDAINEEEGTFAGYASVFGSVVDTWIPTIIHRHSFDKTIKEQAKKIKVLWQHEEPIGLPTKMKEDSKGLYVEAKLTLTPTIKEYLMLMKDGVVDSLSIGFDATKWEMAEDEHSPGNIIRHVKEVRLWEFSACLWGADAQAKITSVHALHNEDWTDAERQLLFWADYRLTQATDLLPAERQRVLAAQVLLQRVQGDVQETLNRISHRLEPMAAVVEPEPDAPDTPAVPPEEVAFQQAVLSRLAEMEALTATYAQRH